LFIFRGIMSLMSLSSNWVPMSSTFSDFWRS
jgi:hypothetical protein